MAHPDVLALQHLLATFPWREYSYKYGRWQPVEQWWDPHGLLPMKWGRTYDTFQLLDPNSGQPIGELRSRGKLSRPAGRLWFAGDPRVAGVYTPAGDGTRDRWLVTSRFVSEKQAREAAPTMRPSEIPAIDPGPYRERMSEKKWPWVVDQPTKPTEQIRAVTHR